MSYFDVNEDNVTMKRGSRKSDRVPPSSKQQIGLKFIETPASKVEDEPVAGLKTFRYVLEKILFSMGQDSGADAILQSHEEAEHLMPFAELKRLHAAPTNERFSVFIDLFTSYRTKLAARQDETNRDVFNNDSGDEIDFDASFASGSNDSGKPFTMPNPNLKSKKRLKVSRQAGKFVLLKPKQNVTRKEKGTKRKSGCEQQAGEPLEKFFKKKMDIPELAQFLSSLARQSSSSKNSQMDSTVDRLTMNSWSFPNFTPTLDEVFRTGEFRRYVEKLENYAESIGLSSKLLTILRYNSGPVISKAFDAMATRGLTKFDNFKEATEAIVKHWNRNIDANTVRQHFTDMKQSEDQSFVEYLESLRMAADNVLAVESYVNPELEKENLILSTFSSGVKDTQLSRTAAKLSKEKSTNKKTRRLDKLENDAIAADVNRSEKRRADAYEVRKIENSGEKRNEFPGESERNYKHNSQSSGGQRGRSMQRSHGYRENNAQQSYQGRQYRGQSDQSSSQVDEKTICNRCKKEHGPDVICCWYCKEWHHKSFDCPKKKSRKSSKGEHTTESFNPQKNGKVDPPPTTKSTVKQITINEEVSKDIDSSLM
jgi:hypothetical protein